MGRKSTANVAAAATTITKKANSKRNNSNNLTDYTELLDNDEAYKEINPKQTRNQKTHGKNTKNIDTDINLESSINQRPRRQIKHKFIKSGNRAMVEEPPPQAPPQTEKAITQATATITTTAIEPDLANKSSTTTRTLLIDSNNAATIDPLSLKTTSELVPLVRRLSDNDINSVNLRKDMQQLTDDVFGSDNAMNDLTPLAVQKPKTPNEAKAKRRSGRRPGRNLSIVDNQFDVIQCSTDTEEIISDDIVQEEQIGDDEHVENEVELLNDIDCIEEVIVEEVEDFDAIYIDAPSTQTIEEVTIDESSQDENNVEANHTQQYSIEYSNEQQNAELNQSSTVVAASKKDNPVVLITDVLKSNVNLMDSKNNSDVIADSVETRNQIRRKSKRLTQSNHSYSKDEPFQDSIIMSTSAESDRSDSHKLTDEQIEISELGKHVSIIEIDPEAKEIQQDITSRLEALQCTDKNEHAVESGNHDKPLIETDQNFGGFQEDNKSGGEREDDKTEENFYEVKKISKFNNRRLKSENTEEVVDDSTLHHKNSINNFPDVTKHNVSLNYNVTNTTVTNAILPIDPELETSDPLKQCNHIGDEALPSRDVMDETDGYRCLPIAEDEVAINHAQSRGRPGKKAKNIYGRRSYTTRKTKETLSNDSESSISLDLSAIEQPLPTVTSQNVLDVPIEISDDSQTRFSVAHDNNSTNNDCNTENITTHCYNNNDSGNNVFNEVSEAKKEEMKTITSDPQASSELLIPNHSAEVQATEPNSIKKIGQTMEVIMTELMVDSNSQDSQESDVIDRNASGILNQSSAFPIDTPLTPRKKSVGRPRKNSSKTVNTSSISIYDDFEGRGKTRRSIIRNNEEKLSETSTNLDVSSDNQENVINAEGTDSIESTLCVENHAITELHLNSTKKKRGRKKRHMESVAESSSVENLSINDNYDFCANMEQKQGESCNINETKTDEYEITNTAASVSEALDNKSVMAADFRQDQNENTTDEYKAICKIPEDFIPKQIETDEIVDPADSLKMEVGETDGVESIANTDKPSRILPVEEIVLERKEEAKIEHISAAAEEKSEVVSSPDAEDIEMSTPIENIPLNDVPEYDPIIPAVQAKTGPVTIPEAVVDTSIDFNLIQDVKALQNCLAAIETDQDTSLSILPADYAQDAEDKTIRRSGRIKTINKTKKRSQGLGVVKQKDKPSTFGDEELSNVSMEADLSGKFEKDTTSNDTVNAPRVKTQEELEKERADRETGLKSFIQIVDNEYRSERIISKEAKKMLCDCFLTQSETERGELGCGDDCLNRMLLIECGPKCTVGERCTNKRFQKHKNADCTIFKTEKKGYGLIAGSYIPAGTFIMEYVGEVLNSKQFDKRATEYSKLMNAHYYFMALSSDCVIDATKRGNISRFINHSCEPNAETQKWTVNGELRIGFFSTQAIMPDEEITFDYQFQRYGKEAQRCFCEAENCRGWIGGEPDSDEELEDDEEEEEESEDDEQRVDAAEDTDQSLIKSPDEAAAKEGKKTKAKQKKVKDPTKKRAKKETTKAVRKPREYKKRIKPAEIMEDPDLDKEIDVLTTTGLKNRTQTLQFSRLMVRAKLQKAKSRLLHLLREADLPCRRLFLDYHGLRLIHSWMSDIPTADRLLELSFRLEILQTLEMLPITNKTSLQDSKVLSTVQRWTKIVEYIDKNIKKLIPPENEETSPGDSGSGTPIDSNDGISSPKNYETSILQLSAEKPIDNMLTEDATTSSNSPDNREVTNISQNIVEESKETLPVVSEVPQDVNEEKISSSPIDMEESKSSDSPITDDTSKPDSAQNTLKQSPSNLDISKQPDVLKVTQILEQSSAIKNMNVDLLKRIISTNQKYTKIIEDSETNDQLPDGELGKLIREIRLLAMKLVTTWEQMPESFKIPKKLRMEQMKEHEREADESYKDTWHDEEPAKPVSLSGANSRFQERFREREKDKVNGEYAESPLEKDPRYRRLMSHESRMSKLHRRQMFAAKVAQENTDRKKTIEQITHEAKSSYFNLDPRKIEKGTMPTCVNPTTGQWYGSNMKPIPTPPSHAHIKPPPPAMPTDPNEYNIPPIDLPDLWRYAINDKGKIYYYHAKILIPQWEPPIKLLPLMQEQTISNADIKIEPMDMDDEAENDNDPDDEDEDVVNILSNSRINAKKLLTLKSDPVLEKYNDEDDSSSTDSDDSIIQDLESKVSELKEKTANHIENIRNPPNLHEEIMAMAKVDSGSTSSPIHSNSSHDVKDSHVNISYGDDSNIPVKKRKNHDKLVQEIRISPLSEEMKRELRKDSRRYKENKAKLRRQKDMLLKRKSNHLLDAPLARKLKKITDGLPSVSKFDGNESSDKNHGFSTSGAPLRFSDSFELRKSKVSAFASTASSSSPSSSTSSSSKKSGQQTEGSSTASVGSSSLTSLTQILVNKLPSIGHKFVPDAKELIMKNTIKPINKPSTPPSTSTSVATPTKPSSASISKSSNGHSAQHKRSSSSSSQLQKSSHTKKKKISDNSEPLDIHSPAAKKIKDRFCSDMSGTIVKYLKPYFSETCEAGRITSHEDFKHLAKKLTFFVMLKELKYCKTVNALVATESVKVKAREYIKKYMGKFGSVYIKPENEQDYRQEDL